MENIQELCSARIVLSELLIAFKTLKEGGRFVFKMFDTFSDLSVSLLYVVSLVFEKVCFVFIIDCIIRIENMTGLLNHIVKASSNNSVDKT